MADTEPQLGRSDLKNSSAKLTFNRLHRLQASKRDICCRLTDHLVCIVPLYSFQLVQQFIDRKVHEKRESLR